MRTFVRDRTGHYGINLMVGGRMRTLAVHRIVALTWIGDPPDLRHVVMHLDDDPSNNAVENLAYGLPAENSAQMVARLRQARGERCARSKLTAANVRDIRDRISRGQKQSEIAAVYGVSPQAITDIKHGRVWKEANSTWD